MLQWTFTEHWRTHLRLNIRNYDFPIALHCNSQQNTTEKEPQVSPLLWKNVLRYWTMIVQLLRIHSTGQSLGISSHVIFSPIFFTFQKAVLPKVTWSSHFLFWMLFKKNKLSRDTSRSLWQMINYFWNMIYKSFKQWRYWSRYITKCKNIYFYISEILYVSSHTKKNHHFRWL